MDELTWKHMHCDNRQPAMPAASPLVCRSLAWPALCGRHGEFTRQAQDNRVFWEAVNQTTVPESADLHGLLNQIVRHLRGDNAASGIDG